MKRHIIIGNPISHSLSPKIHNYWFKENKIKANYKKIVPKKNEVEKIIKKIKGKKIYGMNVTVPYKQEVIPFIETMSRIAKSTNSVNTIFFKKGKIHGDNTDVFGFQKSIIKNKLDIKEKSVLIFGAGGVVPSIIHALKNLKVKKIYLSNRTYENALNLKKKYNFIKILEWGKIKNCDFFINSTSIGLKKGDKLNLNLESLSGKKTFYDIIYNPSKTHFLLEAEKFGHKIINGRDMFLYQAQRSFSLWHNLKPKINNELVKYIYND